MTWFGILSIVLRAFGFFKWADAAWSKHEANVKSRAAANTPKTDAEWTQKAKDGDL